MFGATEEAAAGAVWASQSSWRVAAAAKQRDANRGRSSAGDLLSFDPGRHAPPSSATGWATSARGHRDRPTTGKRSFAHLGTLSGTGGVFPEGKMSFETTSQVLGGATRG